MGKYIAFILLTILFLGCEVSIGETYSEESSPYEFWETSRFNLDPSGLEDKEEIKLLYASGGPVKKDGESYLYHFIVISQLDGDTVNLLTINDIRFHDNEDGSKIYHYISEDNEANQVFKLRPEDLENLKSGDLLKNVDGPNASEITKVARDPEMDDIAENNFPTVFGSYGLITTPEEE